MEMEYTSITGSPCIVLLFEGLGLGLGWGVGEGMFAAAVVYNPSMCDL